MTAATEGSLDLNKLENVHRSGSKIIARCPACAEQGNDKKSEYLVIYNSGRISCIQYHGVKGNANRKRMWKLVGIRNSQPNERSNIVYRSLDEAIADVSQRIGKHETRRHWYLDSDGEKLFVVVRFDSSGEKEFRPFHKNGTGWILGDPP